MIVYQTRIFRDDLRANPEVLYVFGDNLERSGMGGQAGEMRGEPNAVGIATKKSPGGKPWDYFNDAEVVHNTAVIYRDFSRAEEHLERGGVVVVPAAGIGTGLSQMPERCPLTFTVICGLSLDGAG